MIVATDAIVWALTCTRCGRPDWMWGVSEDEALRQARDETWRIDGDTHVCPTCQAEENTPVSELIKEAAHSAGVCGCEPFDRGGL